MSSAVEKLTPQQGENLLRALEKDEATANPLSLIEDGFMKIKTKAGGLETLTLNRAQKYVLNIIKVCLAKSKPIRLIILKARQLGCSTLIEAILYAFTSQRSNLNALVIADDKDGSNYQFDMAKLFQEQMAPHIRPPEKRSNEKKLEFEGLHSQILIDTAENKRAGRMVTTQFVHLSEYAFFNYPDDVMLGMSQAVPSLPGTMIVKESTANGFNHFKTEWDAAVSGENDYIPIFIPWYWDDGYKMSVEDAFSCVDREEVGLSAQMEREGIDSIPERLTWRRWCIKNNCGGKLVNFQQEYPSTPEEAFIASGECAFHKEELIRQLRQNRKPIAHVNIVKTDYKYQLRTAPDGDFFLWETPKPRTQEEYIVSGDACSGSGTDYAALQVRAKRTNSIVMTFRGKIDADELAERAALMGAFYHDAIVAIENDKYGFHANLKLKSIYGNVFVQETVDRENNVVTQKYGWDTNAKTRPLAIGELKEEIRQGAIDLSDPSLIRECLTFIKNPDTKKEEAQAGCNDDQVMCAAIGSAVRSLKPYEPVKREVRRQGPVIGDY
jgi:hypothetical protein